MGKLRSVSGFAVARCATIGNESVDSGRVASSSG